MKYRFAALCTAILLTGVGCAVPKVSLDKISGSSKGKNKPVTTVSVADNLKLQSAIKKFSNQDELREYLENADTNAGTYGGGIMETASVRTMAAPAPMGVSEGMGFGGSTGLMAKAASVASSNADTSMGSSDFSRTNVQVEGVDEADIIKTDGRYVYALVNNELHIIEAFPAESSERLSTISFRSRPTNIYINGDRLIIFGQNYQVYDDNRYSHFVRRGGYTFFKVFDISDKKNPKEVRDMDFEGKYTNSRMIGDYVYFITTNYNYTYYAEEPLLPRVLDGGVELALSPDIYYFDVPYSSHNFTSVSAINVMDEDEEVSGDVYLMDSSQDMYMSENAIYLTYSKFLNEYDLSLEVMRELIYPKLSQEDRDKIVEIESAPKYILNKEEKKMKISNIIGMYLSKQSENDNIAIMEEIENVLKQKFYALRDELEKTVIHKIAVDKGDITYKVMGEVSGSILNQFSMDEKGGEFRIATTKNERWGSILNEEDRKGSSNLYILDDNLKKLGAVTGLAPGERIYSVRFMGDRAYMVTFEQVDPLFVIDLSDSRNPKVLGMLKIPGFSNYLHPYDDNLLIGLGKDTTIDENGNVRTKGLKLSLFDVSDVANPKEVSVFKVGDQGSSSVAEYDHRAFLFSKEKNLLVLPTSIMEDRPSPDGKYRYPQLSFSGAMVFHIDETGFKLRGRIDHSNGIPNASENYWGGYSYYDSSVQRSLFIESVLYTFSNRYLKSNSLGDLKDIKQVQLSKDYTIDNNIPEPMREPDFEVVF
jgi:inhibitor of cysteine peptidase